MKNFSLSVLLLIALWGCKENGKPENTIETPKNVIEVNGVSYVESNQSFDNTLNKMINTVANAGPIKVIAKINHKSNATSIGKTLNKTSVILFGNPALGTPLMQNNQLAGLDLPQKFLIFEDDNGVTRVAYNNAEYLSQRYGLEGEESLTKINVALRKFVVMTTDADVFTNKIQIDKGEGIITKASANNFEVTYAKLFKAIDSNPNLGIMAEIDHQANASSVGLELEPTRLIVFGNPNLGTPLMQNNQTTGIDLPQKIMVWETAKGAVNVSYNDPLYLSRRHHLSGVDDQLTKITDALDTLSNVAITE